MGHLRMAGEAGARSQQGPCCAFFGKPCGCRGIPTLVSTSQRLGPAQVGPRCASPPSEPYRFRDLLHNSAMKNPRYAQFSVLLFASLAACGTTTPPKSDPALLRASVQAIAPAPTEQQPVMMVRVDATAVADMSNVQVFRFEIPGVSKASGGEMANPDKALAYKASRLLNSTQRFRVVSFDEMRQMKQLKEEGLLASDGGADWALKPDYVVTCTVIEMNPGEEEADDGMRIAFMKFGSSESIATVKVAIKVVSTKNAQVIWEGEAQGVQSSKSKHTGVDLGLFRTKSSQKNASTLEGAMELCVMDLTVQLAEHVPLRQVAAAAGAGS